MLYAPIDLIGTTLSSWRTKTVARYVNRGPLVDLACGDNRLVKFLGFGTGVDIENYGGADIVCPNFAQLPFESNSIDSVTILAAINYFENPKQVLKEIDRILSPKGVLVVTQLDRRVSKLWHKLRDRGLPRIAYSEQQLQSILEGTGLEIKTKVSFMFGLNRIFLIRKVTSV
jgi:SAM-dependent methyltransferase